VSSLAALLPIRKGAEQSVKRLVERLPAGGGSPFARIGSTHFARLVVISELVDRHDKRVAWQPARLFFSAEFDIPARGWLEALCTLLPREADEIFGACEGYPGSERPPAVKAWLLSHSVRPGFTVRGNPGATAGEIVDALALRERLIEFAVAARGLEPAELRRRFDEAFG
jgi:hypothetical protein